MEVILVVSLLDGHGLQSTRCEDSAVQRRAQQTVEHEKSVEWGSIQGLLLRVGIEGVGGEEGKSILRVHAHPLVVEQNTPLGMKSSMKNRCNAYTCRMAPR